jgi:hypothetical protein
MYALIEDGAVKQYPYTVAQLRRANPHTSFPVNPSPDALAGFGVLVVFNSTPPEYDTMTQALEEETPVFDDEAEHWSQVWRVRDLTEDELQQRTDAQAGSVRADRNARLAACDWTQLADAPVDSAAWADYRAALRSVPQQEGFPWDVIWPEAPITLQAATI